MTWNLQVPLSRADADGMAAADAEEDDVAADLAAQPEAEPSDSEGEEPRAEPKKKVMINYTHLRRSRAPTSQFHCL